MLALGADGPVGGDKAVAAYFVSFGRFLERGEWSDQCEGSLRGSWM